MSGVAFDARGLRTVREDADAAPLVTLFVIAYKQEDFIEEAVASALAQTYSPLEIILSDDCSPDGTFEIMKRMAAAYGGPHRLVLNRNPVNLGLIAHFNRVVDLAAGRLLVQNAGDDISEPDRVARLAAPWIATGGRVRLVHSKTTAIDSTGAVLGELYPPFTILDDPSPLRIVSASGNCIGATMAFDRGLFERFGPIPTDCFVEDAALFFRAAIMGGIAYVDAPLLRYRMGGLSRHDHSSPGEREFHGDRIRYFAWTMPNCRSFLADMDKADFPERDACRREASRQLRDFDFRVRAARAGPWGRLTMLPEAILEDLRRRSRGRTSLLVKYALGKWFLRRYDAGQPWWSFAPPLGHPASQTPEGAELTARHQALTREEARRSLHRARIASGHGPDVYVYLHEDAAKAEAAA